MRQRPNSAKLQQQCDAWNAAHPIGTSVVVRKDNGINQQSQTSSEAYVMGGHSAVIFITGISGCYDLNRVSPASATS